MPRIITNAIVYEARNIINGHRYIGYTTNKLDIRRRQHLSDAKNGRGHRFHNAIRKYGANNFVFTELFDFLTADDLARTYEREMIEKHQPEYNLMAGGGGGFLTADSCRKISEANRGRKPSLEARKKMGDSHRGHVTSLETREKIAAAQRGKPRSPASIAKMAVTLKGRRLSEETKQKMRDAVRAPKSAETRQKLREANLGKKASEETKARLRASHKGLPWVDNEKRIAARKISLALAHEAQKIPVRCVNDGKKFDCASAADAFYGLPRSSVSSVITGKRPNVRGLNFKRIGRA